MEGVREQIGFGGEEPFDYIACAGQAGADENCFPVDGGVVGAPGLQHACDFDIAVEKRALIGGPVLEAGMEAPTVGIGAMVEQQPGPSYQAGFRCVLERFA